MRSTEDMQIDLERVVIDPDYRRRVIAYLNARDRSAADAHSNTTTTRDSCGNSQAA